MGQKTDNKVMKQMQKLNGGKKTNNKVMKQMYNLWNQKPNTRQELSNDEIDDMLSSDERVDKLYNMMNGKVKENKHTIRLNENALMQIVAESVKKVLKEEGIFKKSPSLSTDGDERLAVNNAIHELTEAVSILNKFLENGMMEKRLLEMADTYCQRGYSYIANLIKLAN